MAYPRIRIVSYPYYVSVSVQPSRYLAAGDDRVIKIWEMDSSKVLVTIAKDGLLANPCFKFNTKGSLLAVTLDTGGVHVLATGDLIRKRHIADISKVGPEAGEPSRADDLGDTSKIWLVSCLALSKSDCHLISSSGGSVKLFDLVTFERKTIVSSPLPQTMSIAFHPVDTKIVAMGMGNNAIYIYNIQQNKVTKKLKSHRKEVTGLAFSAALGVLVSTGADAQLCVWSTARWRREDSMFLQIPTGKVKSSGIHVQFHHDEKHFLAVHETLLFIYRLEGSSSKLKSVSEWPDKSRNGIKCATYSCDGLCVYACLGDGTVGVLTAAPLELVLMISPNAYIPLDIRENNHDMHPSAIAAHPSIPNQFALGLTHGGVYVLEPLESAGQWVASEPSEEAASSTSSSDN